MSDSPAPEYPRDDLIRMVTNPMEFRAAEGDGLGVLTGYAAVFNEDTTIDSWEGKFIERLAPGSFAKTLKDRSSKVKVLFNHGFDPSVGDKPLGKPRTMEERDKGLFVEVPLDDTSYNRDLVASLRSGSLDGMSFRFSVVREEWDDSGDLPLRTLREVKLYEFGPVTFPAYEATTAGVRARDAYQAWRTVHTAPNEISPDGDDSDDADLEVTSDESTDTPPDVAPVESEPLADEPEAPDGRSLIDSIRDSVYAAETTPDIPEAAQPGTSDDDPPIEALVTARRKKADRLAHRVNTVYAAVGIED